MRWTRTRRGGWGYGPPPSVPFEINRASPQANGLVGWWSCFGQNRGRVDLRDMLERFNMAAFNTPTITSSALGPVVAFDDAATEYLQVGAVPLTAVPLSMTCWFNSDNLVATQALVFLGSTTAGNRYFALLADGNSAGDPVQARHSRLGDSNAATTTGFSANTWHHAAGVFPSLSSRTAYIDGGSPGTNVDVKGGLTDVNGTAIGRLSDPTPSGYMSGMIGEARVYNRVLSAAEIWEQFAPQARWDLYQPIVRQFAGVTVAAAAATPMPIIPLHGVHSVIGGGQIAR